MHAIRSIAVLIAALLLPAAAQGQVWNQTGGGKWNKKTNWNPKTVPNAVGATATLGSIITSDSTIDVNANQRTLGTLIFNSGFNYTVNAKNSNRKLIFDDTDGAVDITVQNSSGNGAHTIDVVTLELRDDLTITQNSSGTFTISSPITDVWGNQDITKEGTGLLVLSGNNSTWDGQLFVNAGTVRVTNSNALGTSTFANEVASGATLELQGGISLSEGRFDLAGSGTAGSGAIRNLSGNNSLGGELEIQTAATIRSDAGTLTATGALDLGSGTMTVTGAGDVTHTGSAYGSNGIIKNGSGTLTLSGAGNSYSGDTVVNAGTVLLGASGNASGGDWIIGDGTGSDVVRLTASNQIANSRDVTIYSSGTLDLNGFNDEIANVEMTGGTIETGSGILSIGGSGGDFIINASTTGSLVDGNLTNNRYDLDFQVADGAASDDLTIDGSFVANSQWRKSGAGVMTLTGNTANSGTATAIVDGGTLKLSKTAGTDALASSTIRVNSGGTLLLGESNQINNSSNLILDGGTFRTGETSGFSETLGTLTLSSSSTIDLGTGIHLLNFANSSSLQYLWSGLLTIDGWFGSAGAPGTQGQIFFGNNSSGLTASQLNMIQFSGFGVGAKLLSNGELVPVPEAEVILAIGLLVLLLAFRERHRLFSILARTRLNPDH